MSGFSEAEASLGLDYLRHELAQRPWLLNAMAEWDDSDRLIRVNVEIEANLVEQGTQAILDEVWDSVIATMHFSGDEVVFNIVESKSVQDRETQEHEQT